MRILHTSCGIAMSPCIRRIGMHGGAYAARAQALIVIDDLLSVCPYPQPPSPRCLCPSNVLGARANPSSLPSPLPTLPHPSIRFLPACFTQCHPGGAVAARKARAVPRRLPVAGHLLIKKHGGTQVHPLLFLKSWLRISCLEILPPCVCIWEEAN